MALRIQGGALLTLTLEEVVIAIFKLRVVRLWGLIFGASLTTAKVIQANVGHDTVKPGVEAAFEAEAMQIAINLEKGLLVNVASILDALHKVKRQTEHITIIAANQLFEGEAVASLGLFHQAAFFKRGQEVAERNAESELLVGPDSFAKAKAHVGNGILFTLCLNLA